MSQQRIANSAVVNLLVAVVTMGSLLSPVHLPRAGRRPRAPARVARAVQRLATADARRYDSDRQDAATVFVTRWLADHRTAVRAVGGAKHRTSRIANPLPLAARPCTYSIPARSDAGSRPLIRDVSDLPTHLIRPTVGRAPPGVLDLAA